MENVSVIKKIRELLSDESSWIQVELAVNDEWEIVDPADASACRWCLTGAIDNVSYYEALTDSQWDNVYNTIVDYIDCNSVADFNDSELTTHADVLAVLDKCIEMESS